MRAVIYARYSSDIQSASSIEDQVHLCRKLIEARGWSEGQPYADMAISGATNLRPRFQRMLEDAGESRFGVLVTESIDRLSRDQEHIAGLFNQLTSRASSS